MAVEQKQFQTEVSQLLDIVIHSLYSNKEIFLRELISNASDAIDKARYEGLTNPAVQEDGGSDWKIKIISDPAAGTITISDNGIGMNREEAIESLGTIAHSGTKEFLKKVAGSGKSSDINSLIGQFGVGFYSAFMVADSVTALTRKRGDKRNTATLWKSDAKSSFTVEEADKATGGTDVTLHLREEDKNLINEWTVRRIVTTYSDYIEYPVVMDVTKPVKDKDGKSTEEKETTEETLNSRKALWLKDRAEITAEEQNQFYKHISHDFAEPLKTVQFKAEGASEFYALLFIPARAPFDMFHKDIKYGPMLYVKRVQIMEHCEELVPQYLRFIAGVVESYDLPLNISREILQHNRQIPLIQKNIVRKILDAFAEMKRDEPDKYKKFYAEFGKILKEGIHYDYERREPIAKLVMFESTATKPGETTDLDEYISRMKSDQKDIYYITGANRNDLENSPYLEGLKSKDTEVIFMTDEFDDIIFGTMGSYAEKSFKSVLKGDLDVNAEVNEEKVKQYEELIAKIKESLGEKVVDVRLTSRLKDSAVCLVTKEGAPDAHMERLLKAMGQPVPIAKRTLELNPDHTLIKKMKEELAGKPETISEYSTLLYDQAALLEGGRPENIAAFINKMTELMNSNL
ncbi:MAG: molecular chaperone HtpG [Deferribacteraceae bacterium]|jgi:molecular chaperone HtpG|nr:molecular chaperone HtpG [Deferribacteraceae bacterium]